MSSLNKVLLIGNLTADPQLRTISSGQSVASFSVATNRKWKDKNTGELKEESQFHNIVAWGRTAEICAQYMKKGMQVCVEGRLQTRSWDDAQSGQKKYRTEVLAENVLMLGRKGSSGDNSGGYNAPAAPQKPADKPNENVSIPSPEQIPTINLDEGQDEIRVEDIPF